MSTPELPEDLRLWPADPYRLLGVGPGVSPRELRRAYTRLIRRFKPEQFPDHFRRIREAYELVLSFAVPGAPFPGDRFGDEPSAAAPRVPASGGAAAPWEEELAAAWGQACAGREDEAYLRIRRLEAQRPGHPEACQRLYWLLALLPELDAERSRLDWLAQGLRAAGLAGPLRELYRRELAEEPAEAVGARCTGLLEAAAPAGLVADLLDWRWQAAGRLGTAAAVVGDDLERLRGRVGWEEEEAWVRLLILAVHRLAWDEGEGAAKLVGRCREEIRQRDHVHARLRPELDLLDHLAEVSADWQALRRRPDAPADLLDLIPRAWQRGPDEYGPALELFLAEVASNPHGYLERFDRVREHGPAVLTELGRLLGLREKDLGLPREGRSALALTELVAEFVDLSAWRDYPVFRRELLDFCLAEGLSPAWVAQALADRPAYWLTTQGHLSQALNNDWPLHYVCLAHRLFWA